jgi:hypothetical protein
VGAAEVVVGAALDVVGAALVVIGAADVVLGPAPPDSLTTGRTPAGWVDTTEVALVNATLAVRPSAKIAPMLRMATPARIRAYSTADAPPS